MKFLLSHGADANATNKTGTTALMLAAGDFTAIKLLVEAGANVNARSALGNTPIMLAARPYGSATAVAYLLKHGADVHATNVFGANAIMAAAASGDLDTVRTLLKAGADVNSHSRGSKDAAIWGGGRSPLMWAAARGDVAMIKLLLAAGADVNASEGFGTALTQTAWMDKPAAAELLLAHGAAVNQPEFATGYTALHWAASSDNGDATLVNLLLKHGANPNAEGGEPVDAFLGIPQTPLMLARKRGDTPITRSLVAAGARESASKEKGNTRGNRPLPNGATEAEIKNALGRALPLLQQTALTSKQSFLEHGSKQNCVSCHQQHLPLAALAFGRKSGAYVEPSAEEQILEMVRRDNAALGEITAETTFHPEPAHAYGYAAFALSSEQAQANAETDAIARHLLLIQGKEGQWFNNLPRPPLQTSDVGGTALAVKALKSYSLPAKQKNITKSVQNAQKWLSKVQARNTEELVYQILGLIWAGENPAKLQHLAKTLQSQQRDDGGWAQLPSLSTDAYATGQALFALNALGISKSTPSVQRGLEYLLRTQLEDGSWFVARRAFPFQPTMRSGFPHSRDSWVSAAGTSWASMALALALSEPKLQALSSAD